MNLSETRSQFSGMPTAHRFDSMSFIMNKYEHVHEALYREGQGQGTPQREGRAMYGGHGPVPGGVVGGLGQSPFQREGLGQVTVQRSVG